MIFVVNAANVIAIHVLNGDDIRINFYIHPARCTNISMSFYVISVKKIRGNISFLYDLDFMHCNMALSFIIYNSYIILKFDE